MENSGGSAGPAGSLVAAILSPARGVLTSPTAFFRTMPRSGGFANPLAFVVAMALASSLVAIPLWLLGIGPYAVFPGLLAAFVLSPLLTAVFSFVGAAILFAVWRMMGSQQSYETAYRCAAYMSAISPLAVPIGVMPYVGTFIMAGWSFFLIVVASEQVHGIERHKARIVFGLIVLVLMLMSISAQHVGRSVQSRTEATTKQLEKIGEMSPEEAGKAVGDLLKGLQGSEKDAAKSEERAEE
jgi:hypothetical protein